MARNIRYQNKMKEKRIDSKHACARSGAQFSINRIIYMKSVCIAYHLNWSCLFWNEKKNETEKMQLISNYFLKKVHKSLEKRAKKMLIV